MADAADKDALARQRALDPTGSFIVQAPAGSGKTSLLTQRFLRLLACVERPEEVVAITFTRKAAAEMRHRIVAALGAAASGARAGDSEAERVTHRLALDALANSRRRGWDLERHPSRLHVQTIDGFNHWLARRLPLAARIALSPALADDAATIHATAARRLVARLEEEGEVAAALARLARLLGHDPARLAGTLAGMLGSRELWLPKVLELPPGPAAREEMEALLAAALARELASIRARLTGGPVEAAIGLLAQAAAAEPAGPLSALAGTRTLPAASAAAIGAWRCLAGALLTKQGKPRARLDKNTGFPPALRELKQQLLGLLETLAEDEGAAGALAAVHGLPPARYSDAQWQLVEALRAVLVPAAAELQAVFADMRQVDHAAVAAAARAALGAEDAPSELVLALEYRMRHLLVDEYQDTAPAQEALLRRLVAGWQRGDGHTLFCVGDPMQSIYGFREADVTLFLEAQVGGIGGVTLEPLALERNFRSCRAIVDWANAAFARLLPQDEDYERGAVRHAPSVATRADEPGAGVTIHPGLGLDAERDARTVARLAAEAVAELRALEPAGPARSVAILVRSRSSLPPILAALRRAGVEYRGVELDSLGERPAVRDLLALARALLHPGDRTAWLAVLRAPWCGLALADLHALCEGDAQSPVLTLLERRRAVLSGDAAIRIERVLPVLRDALDDLGREPLGSTVRAAWLALGGPAVVDDVSDLDNAKSCFDALDDLDAESEGPPEASAVEQAIEGLMASPVGSPEARVQVMTIHKAKGLEFDTVILPCLERSVPAADRQLLYWAPVAVAPGRRGIVLASRGDELAASGDDPLERWMRRLEVERSRLELGRLAYVAVTRARRRLHLVGAARVQAPADGVPAIDAPREDTLLGVLWPALRNAFETALAREPGPGRPQLAAAQRPRLAAPALMRLPAAYELPPAPEAHGGAGAVEARGLPGAIRPEFDWAGEQARAVGAIVHRELERLARERLPARALRRASPRWRMELRREGLPEPLLAPAEARVAEALARVGHSAVAERLLDPGAREAESELALTAELDGALVRVRIDRSFVDEAGIRWIVDWKTGSHGGGSLDQFLAQELDRYAPQLALYARVMALYDARPQRLGLYFPLLDRFVEWTGSGGAAAR